MRKLKIVGVAVLALICDRGLAEYATGRNEAPVSDGDHAECGPLVRNAGHRFCNRRTDRRARRVECEARAAGVSKCLLFPFSK